MFKLIMIAFLSMSLYAKIPLLGDLPDGLEFGKPIPEDIIGVFVEKNQLLNYKKTGFKVLVWESEYRVGVKDNKIVHFYPYYKNFINNKTLKEAGIGPYETTLNEMIRILRKQGNVKQIKITKTPMDSPLLEFSIGEYQYVMYFRSKDNVFKGIDVWVGEDIWALRL